MSLEDNFLIDLVSALLYCREVKQQQQKNVTLDRLEMLLLHISNNSKKG